MELVDVIYEKQDGVAKVTINRPEVYNAFRARTVKELIWTLRDAWDDNKIGAVILTGAGEKAFCTGGDQSNKGDSGYDSSGGLGGGIGLRS